MGRKKPGPLGALVVEIEDVVLEAQLDRRLVRNFEFGRGDVDPRRHERLKDRYSEHRGKGRSREPAVLGNEFEVLAQGPARRFGKLRVHIVGLSGPRLPGGSTPNRRDRPRTLGSAD